MFSQCGHPGNRSHLVRFIIFTAATCWIGHATLGGPLLTDPVTLTQPDGSTFRAQRGGDERFSRANHGEQIITQDDHVWRRCALAVGGCLHSDTARIDNGNRYGCPARGQSSALVLGAQHNIAIELGVWA